MIGFRRSSVALPQIRRYCPPVMYRNEDATPWGRHKWSGFITEWPWVRLHVNGQECEAQLNPGMWPDDIPKLDGTMFTLHFRGARFLYLYVIQGPAITRSRLKRARIWARDAAALFNWTE